MIMLDFYKSFCTIFLIETSTSALRGECFGKISKMNKSNINTQIHSALLHWAEAK